MGIATFRIIAITTSALLLVAAGFALFASPSIGTAYLRIIKNLGSELPLLTKNFSLALLGNENNPFSVFPDRVAWSWCLWSIFLCGPIALMIWSIRAADFEKIAVRWCLCAIAYISFTGAVAFIGIIGLLLPFTGL